MDDYRFFPSSRRLWFFGIVSVLLALFLTVSSLNAQRLQDPICGGVPGAGFPVTFLCDTVGSSPTGSWGKLDEADNWFPNPFFWIDVLFYTVLLWLPWFTVRRLVHLIPRHRHRQRRPSP